MYYYKHYSFDLWLTLIKSNPLFKKHRSFFFYQNFNIQNKPLEEVEFIFRKVDLVCNSINEKTEKNIDADEMYLMVISMISDYKLSLAEIDLEGLYQQMEALLFEFLPVIYCNKTTEVLAHLKETGCSASILSNTGFISGVTLRKVLCQLDMAKYFEYQIYSDEVGLSKPNQKLFQLMINRICSFRQINPSEIIHIGDNPVADIEGANAAGINSLLVNSNNTSITKLIPDVTQHLFLA